MIRIAFELDDASVAILGDDAAAGWTLTAYGRVERGNARNDVLGRRDRGEITLGSGTAAASGGRLLRTPRRS
jgi:hypothetical protein